jgi:hypothetical protein
MKPTVKLIGNDGNAFAILGACSQAAKKAGWTKEQLKEFQDKAPSGDYDHLLITACEYFDVK